MTQNEHVYAICCRPEGADDVISSENLNTKRAMIQEILKLLGLVLSEKIQFSHMRNA